MIKSMAAPYTKMHFMPTGGINADNLKSYLDFNKIVCCGGSWMVKKDMVTAGDFEGIKNLTKQAVDTMLGFEVRHVGVNLASADEADELADTLNDMFSFEKKVGNSSIFSGTGFELMKKPVVELTDILLLQLTTLKEQFIILRREALNLIKSLQ